ncbi:NlpC/P60 family protein [Alkalicoccus chagannorensis]|uniref:C40 family peptidase n=1 Tax=Alkalicoccus chagannorensis TaxID=427072 RepID=UPI000406AD1F|nr:NlpC/P60 family protein [Alkalicoccus chagannorensis]
MSLLSIPASYPHISSTGNPSINVGDRSSFVKELQKGLAEKGYNSSSNIDGIFGSKTLEAVQSYQMSNDISNPRGNFYGTAGPVTLGSLGLHPGKEQAAAPATEVKGATDSRTSSNTEGIIAEAKQQRGTPYVWGGTTPSGFDCSGLIQYAFEKNGEDLPRTVAEMWDHGETVSSPERGDLVFFETRTGPSHAGIYLGNNEFVHSGASTGVTVTSMDNPYWSERYLGAKEM